MYRCSFYEPSVGPSTFGSVWLHNQRRAPLVCTKIVNGSLNREVRGPPALSDAGGKCRQSFFLSMWQYVYRQRKTQKTHKKTRETRSHEVIRGELPFTKINGNKEYAKGLSYTSLCGASTCRILQGVLAARLNKSSRYMILGGFSTATFFPHSCCKQNCFFFSYERGCFCLPNYGCFLGLGWVIFVFIILSSTPICSLR